jgi:hypothetical protein
MRSEVENDLVRTLRAAFDTAPPPAPSVADGIRRVRRRRRRQRLAGAAALLTVVVAAVGATFALRPAGTVAADLSQARDVRQVWPAAVVLLPARLPGDLPYTVEAALGDGTFLVAPADGDGGHPPVLLDGRSGRSRPLDGTFPANGLTQFDITPGYIVWSNSVDAGQDVYAQPRTGTGAAVHLGLIPATQVAVAEQDGVFYATGTTFHANSQTNTLYRLNADQAPAAVPSGDGYVLSTGSWAVQGSPQPGTANRLPSDVRAQYLYQPLTVTRPMPSYRNVFTGDQVTPVRRAPIISCTPAACVGYDDSSLVAWDADGSHELRASGFAADRHDKADAFFSSSGRFVQVVTTTPNEPSEPTSVHLWDRATGQVGVQPLPSDRLAYDVAELGTDDSHKTVLDLTRIP